jgi:hypothetical protein
MDIAFRPAQKREISPLNPRKEKRKGLQCIAGTCIVKVFSVSLAARFAGFRGLDLVNLSITTNARGGPGIVLASVAFDAGIISSRFYTTLVGGGRPHFADRRDVAGLCAAQRMAASDADCS